MRPNPEGWNIVVVGAWNVAIFNPQWLGKHIFQSKEVQIQFALQVGQGSPRFLADQIVVTPSRGRVLFSPTVLEDAALLKIEQAATRTLELLTHTPVNAVGINFSFKQAEVGADLNRLFENGDSGRLADAGVIVAGRSFTRQLMLESQQINLTIAIEQTGIQFDFNFNTRVRDTGKAIAAISGRILGCRNTAVRLLSEAYNINLEEE